MDVLYLFLKEKKKKISKNRFKFNIIKRYDEKKNKFWKVSANAQEIF